MDQARGVLRFYHHAYKTEQLYTLWIVHYIKYGSPGLSGLSLIDELVTKESPAFHLERDRGLKGLRVQVMDFNRLYYNEYENDSFRHGLLIAFPINLVLSILWPLDPLNPWPPSPTKSEKNRFFSTHCLGNTFAARFGRLTFERES